MKSTVYPGKDRQTDRFVDKLKCYQVYIENMKQQKRLAKIRVLFRVATKKNIPRNAVNTHTEKNAQLYKPDICHIM